MVQNRAIEFLSEASRLLVWWGNAEQGRMLVNLAIGEVQELLEQLASVDAMNHQLTRCIESLSVITDQQANDNGRGVLIEEMRPMIPARLVEGKQREHYLALQQLTSINGSNQR